MLRSLFFSSPGGSGERFWSHFGSMLARFWSGFWSDFEVNLRLRWGLFSLLFFVACFGFFGLLVLLRPVVFPRLLRDRAGKPRENHRKTRETLPALTAEAAARSADARLTRVSGLAVSMLLLSRSCWFLFLLVLLLRLRLQCLLRSSRSGFACLACGSRSERASRSMTARLYCR